MALTFVARLAGRLYRSPGEPETRATLTRDAASNYALYAAILGATLFLFGGLISEESTRWSHATPQVPLRAENWKLLVNPPPASECGHAGPVSAGCPANPENPALWQTGESRFDAGGQRKRKAKRDFWIGADFTPEMAKQAIAAGANQLILGWVYSDFDLFVDGQWLLHGSNVERQSTVIPISPALLASGRPLRVALLIHPDSEGGAPDYLAAPWTEGLATAEQATAYRGANVFWRSGKPLGLFLVSLVFSLLFFLFWRLQRQKQEYFFLSIYGAIGALRQIQGMDLYRGAFDLDGATAFTFFLYIAEPGFGLLAALAFARGRRSFFRSGVPFFLIAPWVLAFFPLSALNRSHLLHSVHIWITPALYFMGAGVCALQASYLWSSAGTRGQLGARIRQLALFALGMLLIGGLEIAETHQLLSLTVQAFTTGFTHYSVVLLLAAIALQEYRDERQILERSPISKYHRRPVLAESLRGALLCVDLKDSEFLSQESASGTGDSGRLVRACLSHLWGAVLAEKGTVLSTEGDGLHALFDAAEVENPSLAALRATDRMRERLHELSCQLQEQGLHHGGDLCFRAGLALGSIKPVWHEAGQNRVAGWSDAGTGTLFVDTARLMEIERQTGSTVGTCQVVVGAETAFALRGAKNLGGSWTIEGRRFAAKHGNSFLVSVYSPAAEEKLLRAAS